MENATLPSHLWRHLPNDLIMKIIKLATTAGVMDYHTKRIGMGTGLAGMGGFCSAPWIWTRCSGRSVPNPLRGVVIEYYERAVSYLPADPVPAREILELIRDSPEDYSDSDTDSDSDSDSDSDTDSDSDDDDY